MNSSRILVRLHLLAPALVPVPGTQLGPEESPPGPQHCLRAEQVCLTRLCLSSLHA